MKRFIGKIALFAALLFGVVFVIGQSDNLDKDDKNIDQNVLRFGIQKDFDNLDILFAGSSYTYSGVNPIIFDSVGIKSFNTGTATAGPYFTELIIDNYINGAKVKPKSVFYTISPNTFLGNMDNFTDYPIHRYLNPPVSNFSTVVEYSLYTKYFELLSNSFRKGLKNIFKAKETEIQNEASLSLIQNKGFIASKELSTSLKEKSEAKFYAKLIESEFDKGKAEYLLSYVRKLKSQGIEVVFFEIPTNALSQFLNNQCLLDYKEFLRLAKKEFLVLENTHDVERLNFRNIDHLNSSGASIVSKNLVSKIFDNDKLRKLYNLKSLEAPK